MKCLRIFATPDGESHFGEVDIPTVWAPCRTFLNPCSFALRMSPGCMSRIREARLWSQAYSADRSRHSSCPRPC